MDYYSKYNYKLNNYSNMIGGAFPFDNTHSFYIMIKIGGETLKRINVRREYLYLPPIDNLHITLLQLLINGDNDDASKFRDTHFLDTIANILKKIILQDPIRFSSRRGEYELFGQKDYFFVKKYTCVNLDIIRLLRGIFYENLNKFIGRTYTYTEKTMGSDSDIEQFRFYNYEDASFLYAISISKFLGVHTWVPHISIFKTSELLPQLQIDLTTLDTIDEKKTFLISQLHPRSPPISSIIIGGTDANDFHSLLFSYNDNRTRKKYQFEYTFSGAGLLRTETVT
jgi:hypothetical protein